jgi:hypothetical protein
LKRYGLAVVISTDFGVVVFGLEKAAASRNRNRMGTVG